MANTPIQFAVTVNSDGTVYIDDLTGMSLAEASDYIEEKIAEHLMAMSAASGTKAKATEE